MRPEAVSRKSRVESRKSEVFGSPKPAAVDSDGSFYTFERGVHKTDGSRGWADVWLRGHFAWEYKKKDQDLVKAYNQLLLYREDLENPPLLIVCDLDRFEIHTNFTNTPKQIHRFSLLNLGDPGSLDLLRKAFTNPDSQSNSRRIARHPLLTIAGTVLIVINIR